jgi:hypothetical protein
LYCLIIYKISNPFEKRMFSGNEATFNQPYATANYYYYVVAEIKEIWVYNKKNGYIFQKTKY